MPQVDTKPGTAKPNVRSRKGTKNGPGAKKTGPKFTEMEREQRKTRVLQLAVRDYTQDMIAEITGISQQQISIWLLEQKEKWRTTQMEDREQLVAQKRAQYEEVRREAWLQWEKSKEDMQKRVDASGTKGDTEWTKDELVTETRLAAKTFLDIILDTYRQERALLGIDAERKDGGVQVTVGFNWQSILVEAAMQSDPVAALEDRINALSPEEVANLPPITPEEVLAEEQMAEADEFVDE